MHPLHATRYMLHTTCNIYKRGRYISMCVYKKYILHPLYISNIEALMLHVRYVIPRAYVNPSLYLKLQSKLTTLV